MSAEASSVPSTTGSAGTSASRWAKANDQSSGSVFARGGKPRGTGRGRGGRGSKGASSQEAKSSNADSPTEKKAPAKSVTPSSPSLSTKAPAKSNESSGRPKSSSRRPSRTNSTTNSTSFNPVTESTGSTTSTRSQNRRRRSGPGKGPPNGIAPIRTSSKDDSSLRPRRQSNVAVPLTAPIEPTRPHLSSPNPGLDIERDVDAFVERVRAAAMADHRPSTPGSHIDWAGDDDDSLPDLDDWGIPSRPSEEKKLDLMSPLVVDGLTSLPSVEVPPTIEENPNPPEQKPQIPVPVPQLQISPPPSDTAKENTDPNSASPRSPRTSTSKSSSPRNSNFPNNKRDHIRKPQRRSPLSTPTIEQQETPAAVLAIASQDPEPSDATPKSAEKEAEKEESGLAQSMHAPSAEERLRAAGLPTEEEEGLSSSIHAPKALLDSTSAPTNISAHPIKPSNSRTHARAHTTGRPFRGESSGRGFRGRGSPRGQRHELSGGHNRTRSTPHTGAGRGGHHIHRDRPVLTGDALSRLARTIGGGSANTSPGKTPVAPVQD